MSNTDNNFDADTEQLDGEFDQPEQTEEAAPVAPKKSGGSGKFIVILLVLILGGGAGAVKMGFLNLPIPGLAPAKTAPQKTADAALEMPVPAAAQPAASAAALPPAFGTDALPPAAVPGAEAVAAGKPVEVKPSTNSLMPPAIGIAQPGKANIAPPEARTGIENPMDADTADKAPTITAPDSTADSSGADPFAKSPAPAAVAAPTTAVAADPLAAAVPAQPETAPTPVEATAVAKADDGKVEELQKRIDTLEQTVTSLKADLAKKTSELASATAAASTGEAAQATTKTAAIHKTKTSRTAATSSRAVSSRWILKSAKPGMAWVALPGSSEIKAVAVGETLSPIGKITAVDKDASGRWAVTGTRGKINQ